MFERVGRPLDPDWPVRQAVVIWLFLVAGQCTGAIAAAVTVVWWLAQAAWRLLQLLLAMWLGVALPDLDLLLLVVEDPPEAFAVTLDEGGWEELSDDWGANLGSEGLPDRPLPSLAPPPAPLLAVLDERAMDEMVASAGILAMLGSMGDSGALSNVFSDSALDTNLDHALGGLIGTAGTEFAAGGLGLRGAGGGGTGEGMGGLGTLGSISHGTVSKEADGVAAAGDPQVTGALEPSTIQRVVRRHMSQIRYCYQRALTDDPSLGGKVVTAFTVAPDGSVTQASTTSSTLNDTSVEDCILGRVRRMQFPEADASTVVTFPIQLTSH